MIDSRTLPCGCRLDGRHLCTQHHRESVARRIKPLDNDAKARMYVARQGKPRTPGENR